MRLFAGFLCVALLASACGSSGDGTGCREIREDIDPLSVQHVLGAAEPIYLTDPPTSGPHASGPAVVGLFDEPIAKPAQVRALESGGVVVQYMTPLTDVGLRTLLDNNDVAIAIAPAESLPALVVATAWTWKLICDDVNLDAIRSFAAQRPSGAPGDD
ncbi:MAG: hypothetical protein ACI9C1_003261 [Candidatus Aldehydirespiratoraceae bacterium]|jgi:hypothetical protein